MSGPKIVDIRLIEANRERQRRLMRKRVEQLQKQWGEQRQRIEASLQAIRSQSDAADVRAIEQVMAAIDQRFSQIGDDQSLDTLQKHGAKRMAFMDSELTRLQQLVNDSVIEARQRARSMQAAVNDMSGRLQAAGLEQERQALLMNPSVEALEQAGQQLSRYERERGNEAMQQALADLGISTEPRQLQPDVGDPERDRIEGLLMQLELLSTSSDAAELRARLDALDGESDPRQRRLRLDSLSLQISQALQRGKETMAHFALLDELEAQIGVYDAVPEDLLQSMAVQRQSQPLSPALAELRQAVERWCEEQARRMDGDRIRSVVIDSLRELGYDVREGMAIGWADGGSVVLQKAGSIDYAVELQDINGRLRSQVLRYGDPDAPVSDQQRQRDTEIEQQWCTAHAQTLANLRQQGMEAQIMAKREPGEVPLVVVRATDADRTERSIARANQPSQQQKS
jgi:hypothetical protein